MARALASLLVLAACCRAAAARPELPAPTPNILAAVVGQPAPPFVTAPAFAAKAAAADDDGLYACATAEAIEAACIDVYPNLFDLPAASQASCLCCYSATFVGDAYGSCAAYISQSYMSTFSSEYSLQTDVASFCSSQGGNICASATADVTISDTASATAESSTTPAAASSSAATAAVSGTGTGGGSGSGSSGGAEPPACTSAASVIASCSRAEAGFTDLPARSQASCICYAGARFTTAFDGYVDACATYISTASPDLYSDYAVLSTFCEDFAPTASGAAASSSSSTASTGGGGEETTTTSSSPFDFSPTTTRSDSTSSPTATTTVTVQGGGGGGGGGSATTTTTATAQSGLAASSGAVSWAAGALTLLLSFFVLV